MTDAMRKRLLLMALMLLSCVSLRATERVYISTDRTAYLAGDRVWCSLFCVDENGRLSEQSAVAYVELASADGVAVQHKIALLGGRGSGEFSLPRHMATGTYRLMAYTALEGARGALTGSRILSIYQTSSLSRVKGGVSIGRPAQLHFPADTSVVLEAQVNRVIRQGSPFTLTLSGAVSDVAVSVYHEDELFQAPVSSLDSFLQAFPLANSQPGGKVEYEGEIIHATTRGASAGSLALLSFSGAPEDAYLSKVQEDGSIEFVTSNIYGDREMVCEVVEDNKDIRIRIQDNYLHPAAGSLAPLALNQDMRSALIRRKEGLQHQLQADSLALFLPRREDMLLSSLEWERCHLDDYTRFPTVQEIIVEILPTVRLRQKGGKHFLEVAVTDGINNHRNFKDKILAMVDGVVISDLRLLLDFDAMLLEDIDVCRDPLVSGSVLYNGVVNFITKNNYVTAIRFPDQVSVVDFQGVRYPLAYLGGVPAQGSDRRELLYWHPSLSVQGSTRIPLTAPAYEGRFRVVAEGLSADGKPVRAVTSFEVR